MKPWFVLFVLWALSGIVTLRHVYANENTSQPSRQSANLMEEQVYAF